MPPKRTYVPQSDMPQIDSKLVTEDRKQKIKDAQNKTAQKTQKLAELVKSGKDIKSPELQKAISDTVSKLLDEKQVKDEAALQQRLIGAYDETRSSQQRYDALRNNIYAAYDQLGEYVDSLNPTKAKTQQQQFAAQHPKNPAFVKGTPEAKARMAALRAKTKASKVAK